MADDAFALSPISARAAQPSDEDYGAICEAFMETARGRWFLTEYAKRNRNADTRAVLDAVARIEDTLARQKPEAAAEPSVATPDPRIHELEQRLSHLAAGIQAALGDALHSAHYALHASDPPPDPRSDLEEALAPIRHAGQMVQGVAWTLRESGADGRICTLLDQQAKAIALAVLHPAFAPQAEMPHSAAAKDSAIEIFAALEVRIKALLEQEGLAFDIAAAPKADAAQPPQPKIIVPNDDFEIVDHVADNAANDTAGHISNQDAGGERVEAAIGAQNGSSHHAAPHEAASGQATLDHVSSDRAAPHLASVDLDTALFDDAPPAQQIQNPAASLEPVTLGAVIVDSALRPTSARAHADPLAPFARMTKSERIAFFS